MTQKWYESRMNQAALIGALGVMAAAIFTILLSKESRVEKPKFAIINPHLHPDSSIYIKNLNASDFSSTYLNIELDGLRAIDIAELQINDDGVKWGFVPSDVRMFPRELLSDGWHKIRIGNSEYDYGEVHSVYFSSRAPEVDAILTEINDGKLVTGVVASYAQVPSDTITIDVMLLEEGSVRYVPVNWEQRIDKAGKMYISFRAEISNIPHYSEDHEAFAAPYFGLRVQDRIGNVFQQELSYAKFVAPGVERYSTGILADIEVIAPVDYLNDVTSIDIEIPFTKVINRLDDGSPPIFLRIRGIAGKNELVWEYRIETLASEGEQTTVYRNGVILGQAQGNTFVDVDPPGSNVQYQIEKVDIEGNRYLSNLAKLGRLDVHNYTGPPLVIRDYPDAAYVIIQSTLPNLEMETNWIILEDFSDPGSGYYQIVVDTVQQVLRISSPGYKALEVSIPKLYPKQSYYLSIEPESEYKR